MRRTMLFIAALLTAAVTMAQRGDIYSSDKKTPAAPAAQVTPVTNNTYIIQPVETVKVTQTVVPATTVSDGERDVDEYNRRYTYGAST